MSILRYARARVIQLLEEIARLRGSEFPYPHSRMALDRIDARFRYFLRRLDQTDSDSESIQQQCTIVLLELFRHLPLLGFILRSTNVRNAFEVFGPLRRMARDLLEPNINPEERETQLVLSSEWNYSPHTYHRIESLPGFVLIGLPAPESSNPLLIPLSGHELGHGLWAKHNLGPPRSHLSNSIEANLITAIEQKWADYQRTFNVPTSRPADLRTDMFAYETWASARPWALNQAKEVFCDFVGIRIFGYSYLCAFAYLLSPGNVGPRMVEYPNVKTRVGYMIKAASEYRTPVPTDYNTWFVDRREPPLTRGDRFRLTIADCAIEPAIEDIIDLVNNLVSASGMPGPDDEEEVELIYKRFQLVVPAPKCKSLPHILNAAWEAYEDQTLWSNIPHIMERRDEILKELVLKNIELFEVEQILGAANVKH